MYKVYQFDNIVYFAQEKTIKQAFLSGSENGPLNHLIIKIIFQFMIRISSITAPCGPQHQSTMPHQFPTFTHPITLSIALVLNVLIDSKLPLSYHTGHQAVSSLFVQQRETIARISVLSLAIPRLGCTGSITYA